MFTFQGLQEIGGIKFNIEPGVLKWLGVATVGNFGGLAGTVIAYFFKKDALVLETIREITPLLKKGLIDQDHFSELISNVISTPKKPKKK